MPRRSDAKQRMVRAAQQLIRERGYHATAFSDVLELSEAPRGSVYFHFPGGKPQLAMEAAELHAHEQVGIIDDVAKRAGSAAELIEAYIDLGRAGMLASHYGRGCGIAPLITEAAGVEVPEIAETSRRAFTEIVDRLTYHFVALGLERADARALADAVIAGVEGAMITSRALQSPTPYDSVRAALISHANAIAKATARTRR
jgi:TetR/AcrR family transcriptional regulator, lmrAB and yxaGH operons repressor